MRFDELSKEDYDEIWDLLKEAGMATEEGLRERGFESAPLENSDVVLLAHNPSDCLGPTCSLHNRSDHHMRGWQQHWRPDRGIMERICPDNGTGHPDPDDYKCNYDGTGAEWIHGCDGCCDGPFAQEMFQRWIDYYTAEMRRQEDETRLQEIAAHEDAWWDEMAPSILRSQS